MKRAKFTSSYNKTSKLLELVHTDVVGRLKLSYSGYKFYVTFLDDFSRKVWVYPIKAKSQVYNKFIDFYELMKNVYGLSLKTLKSDRGCEYINSDFNKFVCKNGIKFIHSEPGAHEQNGRAERLNQTLNNCVKTLLNWAKLPNTFWDEAIMVAAKLYNLNPHQGNNNLVPDEVFFKKPSDISNLRVFGCKVAFLNNYKKDKLDNNAKQGIFVGYSNNSTGYRILDLETNSIITARDVYFFESLPGTINTPFFSNDLIKTFFDSSTSSIEGERTVNDNNNNTTNNINSHNQLNEVEHNSNQKEIMNKNGKRINTSTDENHNKIKLRRLKNKIEDNKIFHIKTNIPLTYEQALKFNDREEWKIAIAKEFKNIYDNNVVIVVNGYDIPDNTNILDGTWVFTIKDDGTRKARYVIRGFKQNEGIDFIDTYAPTLQIDSLRLTIAIASIKQWNLIQIDIKAAYLNAELKEKIYLKIPKGDKNFNTGKYWLLKKALYGLKQSGRAWNREITKFFKEIGLIKLDTDECIFCKYDDN